MRYFCVMNIGYDAKRLYHNSAGLGNYSRYLVSQIIQRNPNWKTFLYAHAQSPRWPVDTGQFTKIPEPSSLRRFWSLTHLWDKDQLDIYHGLSNELPWNLGATVKTVVTIHDLLYMDYPEDYTWLDRKIYHTKTTRACHNSDVIIAISEITKKDIIDRLGIPEDKIKVIYQSCDPVFFQTVDQEKMKDHLEHYGISGKSYIISVGSFQHRKNQERLIRAYSKSNLSGDVDLVFIGRENKFVKNLKSTIPAKLQSSIHFLHNVNQKHMLSLMKGSLFVVYPSLKEGFGIPVVEGMAMGKAVLTSARTSCAEAGGNAVQLFEPTSDEDLSLNLELLAQDAPFRNDLETKAIPQARKFAPEIEMAKLEAIYRKIKA